MWFICKIFPSRGTSLASSDGGAMIANADLPQVLVIDDEMGPRESLRMLLKPSYQVHTADSVEVGLQLLKRKKTRRHRHGYPDARA